MGVNSLPKTVTRQRRGCDLNPSPAAPESSTLTTRLPSQPVRRPARNSWPLDGGRLKIGELLILGLFKRASVML